MTDLSAEFKALAEYRPTHKVRFVTAASLFDGHDALHADRDRLHGPDVHLARPDVVAAQLPVRALMQRRLRAMIYVYVNVKSGAPP